MTHINTFVQDVAVSIENVTLGWDEKATLKKFAFHVEFDVTVSFIDVF